MNKNRANGFQFEQSVAYAMQLRQSIQEIIMKEVIKLLFVLAFVSLVVFAPVLATKFSIPGSNSINQSAQIVQMNDPDSGMASWNIGWYW